MALSAAEACIGPGHITFGGDELGLTTDDGLTITPEFEVVDLKAAQSMLKLRKHRFGVAVMVKAKFYQLTLARLQKLWDLAAAPSGGTLTLKWTPTPAQRVLSITMPGSNGSTRVLTANAVVHEVSEVPVSNKEYQSVEVTFELIGDADTDILGTIVETASSEAAPTISTVAYSTNGTTFTTFADAATTVPDTTVVAFQIVFNVAIRADQVLGNTKITLMKVDGTIVATDLEFGVTTGSTDQTKVNIVPASGSAFTLDSTSDYILLVQKGLLSNDGIASTAAIAHNFTTTA